MSSASSRRIQDAEAPPVKNDKPPLEQQPKSLPDPCNENTFPQEFRDAEGVGYSTAESQQTAAKLWSIYNGEAHRYDSALVASWNANMKGTLIFSGLFSASLTAFLIESYRTLQPDSGIATVQLLTQISAQLANNASFTAPAADGFQVPLFALVCNTLWFISLTLSITCALLATLVEQWAREFLHNTDKRPSPIRRGRVLGFLYYGMQRFGMHAIVDVIPMLLHVSLMLFLAGLIAFLVPVNLLLVVLMTGIFGLFVTVYALMTILPIISLDCPYSTPFSTLAWSVRQSVQRRFNTSSPPSHSAPLNEVVVVAALEKPEVRDRRAFAWTMESLTDDAELLPFLEAIPEAIHGALGFHLVNDHIFPPLLDARENRLSLGNRIAELMLSCRNIDPDDPRGQRGIIAGMKAIWALSMISARTGEPFKHGGTLWFEMPARNAVKGPWKQDWAESYAVSAKAAIIYSRMNNMRNCIVSLVRAEGCIDEAKLLVEGTDKLLDNAKKILPVFFSHDLDDRLQSLRAWSEKDRKISDLQPLLRSLIKPEIWLEANVTILYEDLPYQLLHTCFKIVPKLPHPLPKSATIMKRSNIFRPRDRGAFDPAQYSIPPGQISGLDWIMRCLLRLAPLLRAEDTAPLISPYLARRNDLNALEFATRECRVEVLMDHLVDALNPGVLDTDVLGAICTVSGLPQFVQHLRSWDARADRLWEFMSERGIFTAQSPVSFSLSALMTLRKLKHIRASPSESTDQEQLNSLMHLDGTWSPESLAASIPIRTKQAMIVRLTQFLDACVQPMKPVHMTRTTAALCAMLPRGFDDVAEEVMVSFAQTWVNLVRHLIDHPTDVELNSMTASLLLADEFEFYHPSAASRFKEAFELYRDFLQQRSVGEEDAVEEKAVLGELIDLMSTW
ncbi:hypothetical protein FB451DRAFT_1496228 [Mycena latifolia]|nr:hypothetical protein FB451DRAFT_1496228 [Mycena latifolia]